MSQENPFPDWVPKVGDVVRILPTSNNVRYIREVEVIERGREFDGLGNPRLICITVAVGKGVKYPQATDFFWLEDYKAWYPNKHPENKLLMMGYQIEVVNS